MLDGVKLKIGFQTFNRGIRRCLQFGLKPRNVTAELVLNEQFSRVCKNGQHNRVAAERNEYGLPDFHGVCGVSVTHTAKPAA